MTNYKSKTNGRIICTAVLWAVTGMLGVPLLQAQSMATDNFTEASDSIRTVFSEVIYFSVNNGDSIEQSECKKAERLLQWALSDTITPITITGWTDKSGSVAFNEKLSLRRARTIRNYLVEKGIVPERITFEGRGVDTQALSYDKARRAVILSVATLVPVEEEAKDETTGKEAVAQPEPVAIVTQSDSLISVSVPSTTKAPMQSSSVLSPWYTVTGMGVSFGRSTFCSFAADGTHPGWNINIAAGRRINRLLSAEVSFDYTRLSLGAYDCCMNLWLGTDGNRYFAPVTGMDSYSYSGLRSISNLVSLGAHLNMDLIAIRQTDSHWSAFVSPAIYAVYSDAKVKQDGNKVGSTSGLHFGLGADLGVQYMFTPQWGLRLTSGINYITGKPIDALPREEHKTNYVWNTALKVIFKL